MRHRRPQTSGVQTQAFANQSNPVRLVNVTKNSHSTHRLNSLKDCLAAYVIPIGQPIKLRTCRRTMTDQNIDIERRAVPNLFFRPFVCKTHSVVSCTTDTAHTKAANCCRLTVDVSPSTKIRSIVISRYKHYIHTEPFHSRQYAVHLQQILHLSFRRLARTTAGTSKVTHKQNPIELRPCRQRIQDLFQQRPPGMNVADDSEDCAQSAGFICMSA